MFPQEIVLGLGALMREDPQYGQAPQVNCASNPKHKKVGEKLGHHSLILECRNVGFYSLQTLLFIQNPLCSDFSPKVVLVQNTKYQPASMFLFILFLCDRVQIPQASFELPVWLRITLISCASSNPSSSCLHLQNPGITTCLGLQLSNAPLPGPSASVVI